MIEDFVNGLLIPLEGYIFLGLSLIGILTCLRKYKKGVLSGPTLYGFTISFVVFLLCGFMEGVVFYLMAFIFSIVLFTPDNYQTGEESE